MQKCPGLSPTTHACPAFLCSHFYLFHYCLESFFSCHLEYCGLGLGFAPFLAISTCLKAHKFSGQNPKVLEGKTVHKSGDKA